MGALVALVLAMAPAAGAQDSGLDQYFPSLPEAGSGISADAAGGAGLPSALRGRKADAEAVAKEEALADARAARSEKGERAPRARERGRAAAAGVSAGPSGGAATAADTFLGGSGLAVLIAALLLTGAAAAVALRRKLNGTAAEQG